MQVLDDSFVGKVLGTYRLEALIGKGGMGAVFLAQQLQLARRVAVKVLLPDVMMDNSLYEEFLIRFQREASLIAGLEHLNITPIYDFGKHEGIAYLVMPYVAGGTLRDVLTRRGALPLQEALRYIEQAAAALDYAHAHGIIHRDLKPSNFLLHPDGRLVLADFGIARMMQRNGNALGMTLTSTGALLGTPEYMAPEMIRGGQIDSRTDIYELGIVLFQMLSGTVPFKGDAHLAVLMKHLQEPVPFLHYSNPAVPPAVDAVIQKATAKNPEDRYVSAGALIQNLKNAINAATYPAADERHYAPTLQALYAPPFDWSAPTQAASAPISTMPVVVGTPGSQAPGPVSTRSRHSWLMRIAVPAVLVLTLGGLLIGIPRVFSYPDKQSSGPTPAQHAQAIVDQFYKNINAWDYASASKLLKTNSAQNGYCSLVDGYMLTQHDEVTFKGIKPLFDGTFKVAITIVATELFATGPVTTTYVGYEVVDPGTWQITNAGRLDKTNRVAVAASPTSPDPIQAAQVVVQQFHSDINRRDYPEAYSLWGADFHHATDYCSFVEGYSQTRNEDVTIDNTTQLSDGTVQALATIDATEGTDAGLTMQVYHETYIVGQENGAWRIISGIVGS
jgi:tRNA A-37 threonylcarbamoyl transferase component Bud32